MIEPEDQPRYRCPHCGAVSYHIMDIRYKYCGRCHQYEEDMDYQYDDHCWIMANGLSWAIRAIHGKIFYLWRGYEPNIQRATLDTTEIDWDMYCIKAVEMLDKAYAARKS